MSPNKIQPFDVKMKNSVSYWIEQLKAGSEDAVEEIFRRYYEPIVRLIGTRLSARMRRSRDEEDIALSAFDSFVRRARQGGFPELQDRDDLWRLLVTISVRKAAKHAGRETAEKRGGGGVVGESAFRETTREGIGGIAIGEGHDPEEELICDEVAAELLTFLEGLDDPIMMDVALWTAQGTTAAELAEYLDCSPRTVERKLQRLRAKAKQWADEQDL